MMSEKEQRELVERARKMDPIEPSRKPPPLFYVYVAIVVAALIYALAKGGKPTTDAELKRILLETRQEDARKELDRAVDVYRRTLNEPSPSR
jgi:hypothetical protein